MTNIELALLLGQPKGVEDRRLINPAKPILQLTPGMIESNPSPKKKRKRNFRKQDVLCFSSQGN